MLYDDTKIKDDIKILKETEQFKDVDIKKTWFYDLEELDYDIKEKQKLLRLARKERKLQPEIIGRSPITKENKKIQGYQILINRDNNNVLYIND